MPRVITQTPSSVVSPPRTTKVGPRTATQRASVPSGAALLAALAILIVSVFNLDIPYYAITPGPAIDVVELIEIRGATTKAVTGPLLLTTVSLHQIKVAEAIRGWFDSSYEILSRAAIIPSGESERDAEQRSTAQMDESQQHAAAAALSHLGYDVKFTELGARVREIYDGTPAGDVLRRGDVIVGVDNAAVKKDRDVGPLIQKHKVGDEIVIKIRRGDRTLSVRMKTIENPEAPAQPFIGVGLDTVRDIELPLAVEIESLDIGGPSAGLMYALGITDLLDGSDLAKRRTIAGTGEIGVDGAVTAVGGVSQKISGAKHVGAEVFLVPADELKEACAAAGGDLEVYGVTHLADAVRVLKDPTFADERNCA